MVKGYYICTSPVNRCTINFLTKKANALTYNWLSRQFKQLKSCLIKFRYFCKRFIDKFLILVLFHNQRNCRYSDIKQNPARDAQTENCLTSLPGLKEGSANCTVVGTQSEMCIRKSLFVPRNFRGRFGRKNIVGDLVPPS